MRRIRTWKRRTARGQRLALSGAVLFFVCLWIFCTQEGGKSEDSVCRYDVLRESAAGYERIPLDDYLIGALAACLPEEYEPETYKAQAVLLRTHMIMIAEQNHTREIPYGETGQNYLSDSQMRVRFGSDYETNRRKCEAAVRDTDRMILQYRGVTVEAPYFAVSAGRTREKRNMTSVSCGEDVTSEEYLTEQSVTSDEYYEKMRTIMETAEDVIPTEVQLIRDAAGYVEWVEWDGHRLPGEEMQELFKLPSASFSIEECEEQVTFITKGVGHGYGMSQYAADRMAQKGDDFLTILSYFFPEYEIVKK